MQETRAGDGHNVLPLELHAGVSLHDVHGGTSEELRSLLNSAPERIIVVGIHLCRALSARAVSIFNCLGAAKAPLLILAPCCLPRLNRPPIPVLQFEEEDARLAREHGNFASKLISRKLRLCRACGEAGHMAKACPKGSVEHVSPPCWRCGEFGHQRNECVAPKAVYVPGPCAFLDVEAVGLSDDPFSAWVDALLGHVQCAGGEKQKRNLLLETQDNGVAADERDWNRHRKCAWIVCARTDPPGE